MDCTVLDGLSQSGFDSNFSYGVWCFPSYLNIHPPPQFVAMQLQEPQKPPEQPTHLNPP